MKITRLDATLVRIPQIAPIAPYANRYNVGTHKTSLILRLETDTGLVGWGETPEDWINKTFEGSPADALRREAVGRDPFDIEAWYAQTRLGGYLASGVEMALWDLVGKATGQPLYKLLGGAVRKKVELAACMGIRPYDEARAVARQYVEMGFSTLKTKAGRRAEEDLEMVRGIRDGVGDKLKLRIDPNMGYAPAVALQLARDLEPYTYQCYGILGVKKVAALCEAAQVPCVFHCSHDLGLKTAAMLHVVASAPNFPLANDCTYYGLEDDIISPLHQIERGFMTVPEGPGLGVTVDEKKLAKYRLQ
jgi:L-alanine-DL-glutamate epimerase-like enolase superfamily enzyme